MKTKKIKKIKKICKLCVKIKTQIGWTDIDEHEWDNFKIHYCCVSKDIRFNVHDDVPENCYYKLEILLENKC